MGSDSFAVRKLNANITALLISGSIGGSGAMYRLEVDARACLPDLKNEERAVAEGLAQFFDRIARAEQGEPIPGKDGASLCSAISQPLRRAIDYLMNKDSGTTPIELLGDLNSAYDQWKS